MAVDVVISIEAAMGGDVRQEAYMKNGKSTCFIIFPPLNKMPNGSEKRKTRGTCTTASHFGWASPSVVYGVLKAMFARR